MGALSREQIEAEKIIRGWGSLKQFQPAGFDLSVGEVLEFRNAGHLSHLKKDLPSYKYKQECNLQEWEKGEASRKTWYLTPGPYLLRFNEYISLPKDVVAYAHHRSTLMRMGAALHAAVGDPGFNGYYEALLVVYNPTGLFLGEDTPLLQLSFHRLDQPPAEGYSGGYNSPPREVDFDDLFPEVKYDDPNLQELLTWGKQGPGAVYPALKTEE